MKVLRNLEYNKRQLNNWHRNTGCILYHFTVSLKPLTDEDLWKCDENQLELVLCGPFHSRHFDFDKKSPDVNNIMNDDCTPCRIWLTGLPQ